MLTIAALLFAAGNGGVTKQIKDSSAAVPPVNGADTGTIGTHTRPDSITLQGDSSTKNNGQNTGIDTTKNKPK